MLTQFLTHPNALLREACKQALETGENPLIDDDLDLKFSTEIDYLPENLIIKGSLNLYCCGSIKALPEKLVVYGDLDLAYTNLQILPQSLKVKRNIFIEGTDIRQAPVEVEIGGKWFLDSEQKREGRFQQKVVVGAEKIRQDERIKKILRK